MLKNYTSHDVHLKLEGGIEITIPSSWTGTSAEVKRLERPLRTKHTSLGKINIRSVEKEVKDLPKPEDGIILIINKEVFDMCKHRIDLATFPTNDSYYKKDHGDDYGYDVYKSLVMR